MGGSRATGLLKAAAGPPPEASGAPTHSHVVLFVHFDGLVGLGGDQSAFRVVEDAGEDARLAVQGTGLHSRVDALEVVPGPPVPQVDGPIVSCGWRKGGVKNRHDWRSDLDREAAGADCGYLPTPRRRQS